MCAPNRCATLFTLLAALLLATPAPAFAYAGPGPGLEMLPYFFSLLAWVGMAVSATLAWPLVSLVRRVWPGASPTEQAEHGPAR